MRKLFYLSALLLASIAMNAEVRTVPVDSDLQAAINGASSGDEVKVQAGTFTGNFTMKEGVQVSGGWNETFTTQTEYGTILDAQGSDRVLNQETAFTTLTVWSNFTIQNGKLTTALTDQGGAGVFLNKNGRVQDCLIQNNIVNTTITGTGNDNAMGGGVSCNSGNADPDTVAYNCVIKNNSATHGGGVRVNGKGVVVYKCVIEDNQTTNNAGGGIQLHNGSHLVNCIVRNNKANGDTGGVRLTGGNVSTIINCLIVGNVATNQVGGIGMEGNLANVINCTIVGNEQKKSGATASLSGVKVNKDKDPNGTFFVNNIVWGNITGDTIAPQGVYYISRYDKTKGQRSYNAIQGQLGDDGTTTCIKLTNADPGFVDAANGDYRLLETSALVNFGNKTHNTLPTDLDGKQRVRGGKIDLGAYEFQSPESRDTYVKVGDNLQDSINLTVAGYNVYVQAGTFTGNFTMKDGVNVSGGWNADFTEQTDYATILDANADGRVLNQPAAFSVLTVWSNFTIQNGKLTAQPADKGGAGVFLNKKGRVQNCLIQNNVVDAAVTAETAGGGVCCNSGTADPDTVAYNCVIKNNTATHGGGVRVSGEGIVIYNCVIEDNQTTNNAAGGIQMHNGGHLVNCIVRNNKANGDTGGVRLSGGNISTVINCLIVGNEATNQVGGIAMDGNLANIINCTIVGNKQKKSGATASLSGVKVKNDAAANGSVFVNNIVWGNITGDTIAPQGVYYISRYDKTKGQRSYNAIQGQLGDDGTTTCIKLTEENPGFADADPENGDFTLVAGSKLIDFGSNVANTLPTDLAGNKRIQGKAIDLGCYEAPIKSVREEDDLQAAINAAVSGETVYVQAGTFTGNFIMKDGVNVSGGWNADFSAQTDYATILDGNAAGSVVTQPTDFSTLTIWSNLTLTNGSATNGGGASLCKNGQLKHCVVENNTASGYGGGVGNNSAAASDVLIDDCIIKNNIAKQGGGARICGTIQNSQIINNSTSSSNTGGVYLQYGRILNCIVKGNVSNENTGGVRAYGACYVVNCLIANNKALGQAGNNGQIGGLSWENGGATRIINNTIVNNEQTSSSNPSRCGVRCAAASADAILANNVIWGNKAAGLVSGTQCQGTDKNIFTGENAILNNAVYNAAIGVNGLKLTAENPGFVDPENGDFRLVLSQLVEGGNDEKVIGTKDLAGNNRIINGHVDYGCYEYTGAATLLNEKEESEFEEGETDVVMRRSFVADGSYYTLALPFAMSQEQIATVFGACQISELESSILKSETAENIELRLNFKNVQTIEANKPYLFLPQADVTNPVFEAVTLSKTTNDIETDYADMKAILTPTTFDDLSDGTYFLGSGNMLQPLNETSSTVKAYRGYFVLHQKGEPAKTINKVVRAMVNVNNAPTAITMVAKQAQTKKMLINNQIVIMRNDNVYTVLGSQIY